MWSSESAEERERGDRVAALLKGAWRDGPPELKLSTAELHRIAPLLLRSGTSGLGWWRVRNTALRSAPAATDLQQAYRLYTLQTALHEAQIKKSFAVLRASDVEPLLAKGWAAAKSYPEPGLRPYGDVDLYVRPEQYRAARGALDRSVPGAIDLHRGLRELDDVSFDDVFARSQLHDIDGVKVRVMGPEDHLRLLCLHLMRHGAARPVWLCDVGAALESRSPTFDWDYFRRGNPRRTDYAMCTLGVAHQLLSADLDGTPAQERAERLPSWLTTAVLRQWGAGFERRRAIGSHPQTGLFAELGRHWPNGIEATVRMEGPFNDWTRLPFQLSHSVARVARFTIGLAGRSSANHVASPAFRIR